MRRSTAFYLIIGLLSLTFFLTACGDQDGPLPTLIPSPEAGPVSDSPASGESPRGDDAASGIPPTWTPGPAQEAATPLPASDAPGSATDPESEDRYVVQAGDTLAEIATQFAVDLDRLAQANDILDVDHIEVGQELVIPR